MKKIKLVLLMLTMGMLSFAQYSTTTEGDYDFVPNQTLIGISFEYTGLVNGFEGMEAYVDYRYQDIELMKKEKDAIKWKEGWEETIANANNEFVLVLNDELVKKSPTKFGLNAETEVYGVMVIEELTLPMDDGKSLMMGGGANAFATMSGKLSFYDADGNVLAVEEYKNIAGIPSTSMYTMGDGFKINSCYKKAAKPLGRKLYKTYFDKKKK